MAIFRLTMVAAIFAGLTMSGSPALACDSLYPWMCKPVPSIDPPETAAESKAAAKPLQITSRRARAAVRASVIAKAKAAKAAAKAERPAQTSRKRIARKSATGRWAVRARHAKIAAARVQDEQAEAEETIEPAKIASAKPREAAQKPITLPARI